MLFFFLIYFKFKLEIKLKIRYLINLKYWNLNLELFFISFFLYFPFLILFYFR